MMNQANPNALPDLPELPELPDLPDAEGGLPDLDEPGADLPPLGGGAPDLDQPEAATSNPSQSGAKKPKDPPVLERREGAGGAKFKRSIYALPVTVDIVVGRARPTVTELLGLDEGSLLSLDRTIEDPVDLCVDGRVIARGELVEMEDGNGIGVRITQVVDVAEDALG